MLRDDINQLDVVSIKDFSSFVNNVKKFETKEIPVPAEPKSESNHFIEHNERQIDSRSSAAILILQGHEKKYNMSKKKEILENQFDLFAGGIEDNNLEKSITENLDSLVNNDNPFHPFNDIKTKKEENEFVITFFDENKTYGVSEITLKMPIVDDKKEHVAILMDNLETKEAIQDSQFDELCQKVGSVLSKTVEAIKAEGKPTYQIHSMLEGDFVSVLSEIKEEYNEEYGKNSFQHLDSVYKFDDIDSEEYKKQDYMSFKFSDKLMKKVNERYSDQRDCEEPNMKVQKNAVDFPVSDTRYNGSNDMNPVVIIREPWMIKNAFSAAMHTNFIEYLKEERDINQLHEAVERPSIKRPYRPSEDLEQKTSMGMSL